MYVSTLDISSLNDKILPIKNTYFAKRIDEYSGQNEKKRTYACYVLLKKLAKKIYNVDIDDIDIVRTKEGKPVVGDGAFCFNIAHSGDMIAIAISQNDVGIDIEKMRPYDSRIAKKFFPEQVENISNSQSPDLEFTREWTVFEAKVKLFGSIALLKQTREKLYYKSHIMQNYVLTTCSLSDEQIHFVQIEK